MKNQFIQYYPFVRAGVHSTVRLATGDGIESDKQIYGDNNQNKYRYLARRAFLVYLGWIVVASLLMTLIYAKYQLGIVGIYEAEIGIVSLCAVAGINIATIIKEKNIATALVFVWAMYGISQVNGTMGSPIWWTVHGLGLVMIAAIWREGRKWVR